MALGFRNASFHKAEDPSSPTWSATGADIPAYVSLGDRPAFTTTRDVDGFGYTIAFDYLSNEDIAALVASGLTFIGGDPSDSRPPP